MKCDGTGPNLRFEGTYAEVRGIDTSSLPVDTTLYATDLGRGFIVKLVDGKHRLCINDGKERVWAAGSTPVERLPPSDRHLPGSSFVLNGNRCEVYLNWEGKSAWRDAGPVAQLEAQESTKVQVMGNSRMQYDFVGTFEEIWALDLGTLPITAMLWATDINSTFRIKSLAGEPHLYRSNGKTRLVEHALRYESDCADNYAVGSTASDKDGHDYVVRVNQSGDYAWVEKPKVKSIRLLKHANVLRVQADVTSHPEQKCDVYVLIDGFRGKEWLLCGQNLSEEKAEERRTYVLLHNNHVLAVEVFPHGQSPKMLDVPQTVEET